MIEASWFEATRDNHGDIERAFHSDATRFSFENAELLDVILVSNFGIGGDFYGRAVDMNSVFIGNIGRRARPKFCLDAAVNFVGTRDRDKLIFKITDNRLVEVELVIVIEIDSINKIRNIATTRCANKIGFGVAIVFEQVHSVINFRVSFVVF